MTMNYVKRCDIKVRNVGSEEIPPFACMQVSGWKVGEEDDDGRGEFKVKKPDDKGKAYLINSPYAIPANKPGDATKHVGAFVLYEGTLPSESEGLAEWGPKKDSWAITKDGKGFLIAGQDEGDAGSQPGFPSSASTKRVRVIMQPAPKSVELITGFLIKDLPAAVPSLSSTVAQLTPGYADAAVIALEWSAPGVQDLLTGVKTDAGALEKLPAVNAFWPTIIKAAETTKGLVIVKGVKETRKVYPSGGNPEEKSVFVVHDLAYPVTIVTGKVSSSVQGGDWVQSVERTLWGRAPEETNINVKNPDSWNGPAQGYAVAIRQVDGIWWGLDLECEP